MRAKTLSVLVSLALTAVAAAQSTAFTYQGSLKSSGAPVSGPHDFRFTLFNAASGGAQIGSPQCVDNVVLADGLFTTAIDFGQQFGTTEPRFLQIEVRTDTGLNCSTSAGLIPLAPRQPLTAAPFASHAKTAFSLAAADGSPANAVNVANDGKVGIGTSTPTHTVHIATPEPTLALQDTDSVSQQVGYVSYRDAGNIERAWVGYGSAGSPVFSIVNFRPSGHIALLPFSGGNVGIGTSTPTAALEVHGKVKLGDAGELFAPGGQENLGIVRGVVNAGGGVITGTGFTVTHPQTGIYTITFSPPFASLPAITATGEFNQDPVYVITDGVTATSATLRVGVTGSLINNPFHFIAIGPR